MPKKTLFITIEIEVDTTGEPTQQDILGGVNKYVDGGRNRRSTNDYSFYVQQDTVIAVMDENGKNYISQ